MAFLSHTGAVYGANRSLLVLLDGLREMGIVPFVVLKEEGPMEDELSRRQIAFERVPMEWWVAGFPGDDASAVHAHPFRLWLRWRRQVAQRLMANVLAAPALLRLLRQWKVDAVYTNSSVIWLGWLGAKLLGLPHVWHMREFNDLDFGYRFDFGKLPACALIRQSDFCVSVSRAVARHFALSGSSREKDIVVYNGVFDSITALADDGLEADEPDGGKFIFLMVGMIQEAKDQELALGAMKLLQNTDAGQRARLQLLGGGNIEGLRKKVRESGLEDAVEFLGYQADPWPYYRTADALLMCSRYEAMGRVTAEAMVAGLPVIGRRSGGTPELVEHGLSGLLFDGGESDLAGSMEYLIRNPDVAREMGKTGKATGRERFNNQEYVSQVYGKVFESLERDTIH